MIFYVIGNGFDLHYNLPTSYWHFKYYLIQKGEIDIVRKIDDLFWERGDFNPKDIEKWSDFENMLTVFNNYLPMICMRKHSIMLRLTMIEQVFGIALHGMLVTIMNT